MKYLRFLLVPVLVVMFTVSAFSNNNPKPQRIVKDAVPSLLMGMESDNFGLQTSSAYMLGELRATQAVIPLMRMLHNSDKEEARIMAAVSLSKIDSKTGMYAVKEAAKYDESERVRKICFTIYLNSIGIEPVSADKQVAELEK